MKKEIQDIKTRKLAFDPENPRFYRLSRPEMKDEEIVLEMLENEGVVDLMESIGARGYFPGEPLLVVKEDAKFVVVEGNRRLLATKLLNGEIPGPTMKAKVELTQADANHKPTTLPCVICDNRDEVMLYLGYRHVSGVKEWDSLSKAYYVQYLLEKEEGGTYKERLGRIKKIIGTNTDYLSRLMAGLAIYELAKEKAFFKLSIEPRRVEFSLITTSLSYEDIRLWLGIEDLYAEIDPQLNIEHVTLMFKFLFVIRDNATPVIRESREIRKFSYIVKSEAAIQELNKTGDMEAADLLSEGPAVALRNLLKKSSRHLDQSWSLLGGGRVQGLSENHLDTAKQIREQAKSLIDIIERHIGIE